MAGISWDDKFRSYDGFGAGLKKDIAVPGPWYLWIGSWAEMLPYYDNRMYRMDSLKNVDSRGLPLVSIHCEPKENEKNMRKDMQESASEMLHVAGYSNVTTFFGTAPPGAASHEMGTVRMGRDPKTSVLNGFNQMHDVKNVFITDGSCMTSSGCQNPSLTYMALTARACEYAVNEMKKGNI